MAALYRRDSRGTGVPAKEQMAICDFKLHIAECLSIQTAKTGSKKQGRTSVDLEMKRKGGALPLSAKAIRMDANDHWLTMYLTIGRCRFPRCKGRNHVICSICSTSDRKMALCSNYQRNCFIRFHTKCMRTKSNKLQIRGRAQTVFTSSSIIISCIHDLLCHAL